MGFIHDLSKVLDKGKPDPHGNIHVPVEQVEKLKKTIKHLLD